MISDIKTLFWFLMQGPKFYSTLWMQIFAKLMPSKDSSQHTKTATRWCQDNLTTADGCFQDIGISVSDNPMEEVFSHEYELQINNIIQNSKSNFGGGGYSNLIYTICEKLGVINAIETGVAYGWSSAAILKSISNRNGQLISIDMPMLHQEDYHLIGVAVEPALHDYWELNRVPDRYGLPRAILSMEGSLDLVHYDSDKSYYGRKWSQEIIWKSLKIGGIFISDDIEDNTAFMEFVTQNNLRYSILEFEGKYVGIIKKLN